MPADKKTLANLCHFQTSSKLPFHLKVKNKKKGDRVTLIGEKKEDPDQSVQPQFHHGVQGTAYVAQWAMHTL